MEAFSIGSPLLWAGFVGFVLAMLALDLGVFHRKTHAVGFREALVWSAVWVALALLCAAWMGLEYGARPAMEFLTGYVIEKSLSVDNIFVFVVVFGTLGIPPAFQHRVLFWGILGALVLRAAMILAGTALLARFEWVIYVFGAMLLVTGVKLFVAREEEPHPERSLAFRFARRFLPATHRLYDDRFFVVEHGRRLATPLFLALLLVELSDVVFAVDSIPAIFAVTRDPFIVFTSNIFAILGLRSLFFVLAGMVEKFAYLKIGLSAILVFVGAKMLAVDLFHVPPAASLAVIVAILAIAIAASLRAARRAPVSTAGVD